MKLASGLLSAVLLAVPLAATATIYKWTDEKGTTVFSNRRPAADATVSNMQVVVEDEEPAAAPKPAPAPKPDNGNALQERVRALEQQVQALQSPAASYAAPYPGPYAAPAQLPPPPASYYPPPDYYPPQYYPSYYPPPPAYGYAYPYYPFAYPSFAVIAPGRFARPVHHGFGGFRFGVHPVPVTRAMGVSHRRF
jgi:hypothetical protein